MTLREIHTMKQVRISVNLLFSYLFMFKIEDVVKVLKDISDEFITWEDVLSKYPLFEVKSDE